MLRTIVGTWESRDAWESWHGEDAFRETRDRLDGLQARPSETTWYEVIEARHGE
jgi:heme-degrading monooxygenase HmoA